MMVVGDTHNRKKKKKHVFLAVAILLFIDKSVISLMASLSCVEVLFLDVL